MAVYCTAAAAADAVLRTNTEEFFPEALEAAGAWTRQCGAATPRLLDGVPVSIKDQFVQRGADSTCGLAAHVFDPAEADGVLVELLRDAGAIPFVRTNVPQALLLPESDNAVYGRTDNPYDRMRTPGGSSGGEGALIAARGSVLGIGTDIGGSIVCARLGCSAAQGVHCVCAHWVPRRARGPLCVRALGAPPRKGGLTARAYLQRIPASFSGVYGFKPTPTRITSLGVRAPSVLKYRGQVRALRGARGRALHARRALARARRR